MTYGDGTSECACGQTFSTDGHLTDSFEFHKEKTMAFQPIDITRIDADHYIVGSVCLTRTLDGSRWEAVPLHGAGRPLFTASSLEEILDMAHGACEMMRPAEPTMSAADSMAVGDWMDDHGVPRDAR
jgi:hypothetical protein